MKFRNHVSLFVLATLITACGGSDGGGADRTNTSAIKSGVFIDSAVEGLSYSTATQSGLTNSSGEFRYRDGEVVTFKLGNVEIGSAFGADYLTPVDITNSFLPSDDAVSNIARLLQTLDADGDPENGIDLPATIASLPESLDINDSAAVESMIGQGMVDATTAQSHLDASIAALPPRSVDDVYQRVTVGTTGIAGCPDVSDAQVTVSRDSAGERIYEGSISLSNGGQYLFTADDRTIRNPAVLDDLNHDYRIDLNNYEGKILIRTTEVPSRKCGEVHLTTDTAVNLPPIVRSPKIITTIPGCTSPTQTYSETIYFYGHDKDGFIVNDIDVSYGIEGNPLTALTNPGDTSGCELLADEMSWDPAPPTKGGWYCSRLNVVMDNIPCNAGTSWEVSATDNEGLTTTLTGGNTAPQSGGLVAGSLYQCHEDYPDEACDIVKDTAQAGMTVTSHPAGSCASLVPGPSVTLAASEFSTADSSVAAGNLILEYDFDLTSVSCLVVVESPVF